MRVLAILDRGWGRGLGFLDVCLGLEPLSLGWWAGSVGSVIWTLPKGGAGFGSHSCFLRLENRVEERGNRGTERQMPHPRARWELGVPTPDTVAEAGVLGCRGRAWTQGPETSLGLSSLPHLLPTGSPSGVAPPGPETYSRHSGHRVALMASPLCSPKNLQVGL